MAILAVSPFTGKDTRVTPEPEGEYFFEKQTQQVIENTRQRPKSGQNKPKSGHFSPTTEDGPGG